MAFLQFIKIKCCKHFFSNFQNISIKQPKESLSIFKAFIPKNNYFLKVEISNHNTIDKIHPKQENIDPMIIMTKVISRTIYVKTNAL